MSTKLLRINAEREIVAGQAAIRQPDSKILRSWEIAGASHVDYWYMTYRQGLVARDGLAPFNYQCDKQPLSHVNNKYVLNAGYDQLSIGSSGTDHRRWRSPLWSLPFRQPSSLAIRMGLFPAVSGLRPSRYRQQPMME